MRILDPPLVVEIDNFFESLEPPVVHVWCTTRNLPQGRSLEGAYLVRISRHHVTTEIHLVVIPADAQVMKFLVAEIEPGVALRATGFLPEQNEAVLRRL